MPQRGHGPGRRRFLNWLLGSSLGALAASALYPVLRFLSPPRLPEASTRQVDAGPTNDPELLDKGYKIVQLGGEPVLVIRVSPDEYRAFAATCTHLDCIVEYQKKERRIWCNCHNGHYDLRGRVVAGPPPRPLATFKVDLIARDGAVGPRAIVVSRA